MTTAYRVREESAVPLALPGQLVLGGQEVLPSQFDGMLGRLVAITLSDGASIFKRVGSRMHGEMAPLCQFESIGGLGASEILVTEDVEDQFGSMRHIVSAREILGVLYDV
jgi:hypothetical protein